MSCRNMQYLAWDKIKRKRNCNAGNHDKNKIIQKRKDKARRKTIDNAIKTRSRWGGKSDMRLKKKLQEETLIIRQKIKENTKNYSDSEGDV